MRQKRVVKILATQAIMLETAPLVITTTDITTKSNDKCIYGVYTVFMLAIAICVVFAYNKKSSQIANKE